MRTFTNLPSTTSPINATNLNGLQTDILTALGLASDTWSSSATYAIGDIVVDNNCLYENTTGTNTATRPSSDSTNWALVPIIVNS